MRWGLWRLALPFALAVLVLVALPLGATVVLATLRYDGLGAPQWVGLQNLERLWADPTFWTAYENSLLFAVVAVPLRLVLAGALALALQPAGRNGRVAGALAFAPTTIPDVAFSLLWLWLLNPLYGPLSLLLASTGLVDAGWILTPWGARAALVLMTLFQGGELMVVVLAARRELPAELYEACAAEGASPLYVLRRVTLPLLSPVLALLAARDVAWTLQTTFVPALLITRGGPRFATTFLPLYAYQNGFEYLRFGYAAAITLAMFVLSGAMVVLQLFVLRRSRSLLG